ncbi:MerR family DNA-binding transcriptional regulator [Lactobacillus delbrueckii]|uniref:MerR family DNA-binding transcriptional regulator n=1 Tax=Lactobacillus delbrueckii TaxID=1584 RepID=UPI00272BD72E|nr:MerR family DNA-binding transcriptional regulator [Lactobacillus delbrueckii]WKZ97600.1 MerR family DNA-binding transcriptional regulator [Lactobacillus delbrueckii]
MCAVTKKALYVYEAKGLLKPAVVKDNGYRYYRLEQWTKLPRSACWRNWAAACRRLGTFSP